MLNVRPYNRSKSNATAEATDTAVWSSTWPIQLCLPRVKDSSVGLPFTSLAIKPGNRGDLLIKYLNKGNAYPDQYYRLTTDYS
ncbi:hypothetical protein XM38_026950 [Halomicronema hongdechloris C2206]|uniref:Uncharacterized protein n=1 Tax=Halomicronema hongdechloris C2206 TaxID=1641165 RepID=A0A1Z3HN71_9CYAN|nr:hypothetical protein XM38_026950 [Halomicronema hongdechloris C2206]